MATKEELQKELQDLYAINLVDFAINVYGFQIDADKTAKENSNAQDPRYIFVTKDADPAFANSESVLLISKVNKPEGPVYMYKNIFNDLDRGNILSFIKARHGEKYSVPFAKKKIKDYTQNLAKGYYKERHKDIVIAKDNGAITQSTEEKLQELANKYKNLPLLKNYEYLSSRGLDKSLLQHPILSKSIRNEEIYEKVGTKMVDKVKYVNTVFPIYNFNPITEKGEFCGFVRKNFGHKFTATDSLQANGLWMSAHDAKRPLQTLILCENPIDGISYVQMKLNWKETNFRIIATNGEITQNQLAVIQTLVSRHEPQNFVLANDNCVSGQAFNAKVLAHLRLPDALADDLFEANNKVLISADIDIHKNIGGAKSEIVWKFSHDKNTDQFSKEEFIYEHIPAFQRVVEYYEELNKEMYLEKDEEFPFTIQKQYEDNKSEIKIIFHKSVANWEEINKSILALKFDHTEHLQIDISKNKDFNEDLQEILKIGVFADKSVDEKKNLNSEQEQGLKVEM